MRVCALRAFAFVCPADARLSYFPACHFPSSPLQPATCAQVAVPTSVGYGAAFGGVAPLLAALNTCSPGVAVVNIDNGVGAALVAARILAGMRRTVSQLPQLQQQ